MNQLGALSGLFSSGIIQDLGRTGKSRAFASLLRQSGLILESLASVGSAFDAAFSILARHGLRHEYIYKSALTQKIVLGRHSLRTASILREFAVGKCKADIAILNGTATVYEIKSERDSLVRLENQVATYSTVFPSVYVVCSQCHVDSVLQAVPQHVGILCLNQRYQITTIRSAVDSTELISPISIFEAVRTDEARQMLRSLDINIPSVPNTRMRSVLRDAFSELDGASVHMAMVATLKKSRNSGELRGLVDALPNSLKAAALLVPLRKLDHGRLVNAINTPLNVAASWG